MPHATLQKFGYPALVIHEASHWCVLLRRAQVTLGSLVLVCKEDATQFSGISDDAFGELAPMVRRIETALGRFRPYDRLNYLMLMMVDPHVHFHIIPRYAQEQQFSERRFPDKSWPGPPDLQSPTTPDEATLGRIARELADIWKMSTA